MKFKVFFSNKTADQRKVDQLQATLSEVLPNLPFDDLSVQVPDAKDWQEHAGRLIADSDVLVCIVGSHTYSSEPIDWEIWEAHECGKPMIVARLSPDSQVPPSCEELHLEAVEWEPKTVAGLIGESLVERALFIGHDWGSGDPDPTVLWNQYNLMAQSWESLIARRQTVNTLYISAAAALLAGVGALISALDKTGLLPGVTAVAFLSGLGAALCFNWRRTLVSYGLLSKAKSKVVGALETHLPARIFDAEWSVLEAKQYNSTTQTDTQTAQFFLLLFSSIAVVATAFVLAQVGGYRRV